MNRKVLLFCLLALCSFPLCAQVQPTWESIEQRGYPQWFADAKLGIFIHWGVYSVPSYASEEGYAEWYYRGLTSDDAPRQEFQKRVFGENSTYQDLAPLWKAELWNPDEWAELFRKSGAKYVLLVSKHHDGFCLWDSKFAPKWNSVQVGPKRDICAELTDAVRARGLKMGFYYSLPEWTNPLHRWYQDPDDEIAEYVDTHMIPQFKELVTKYKPSIIFSDGEWNNSAEQWHAAELISWYYNQVGDDAIVNDRWGSGANYGFRTPEYSAGITKTDRPWAECRGLGRSFGLNRNEPIENYLSSDELIRHFAMLVAAGGGMTLNVGPAADGKIPLLQQERLLDLGKWLEINGEAIYGTRPYKKFYEMKPVTVNRVDEAIDFDWVRNSPDPEISCDNFKANWKGMLNVDKTDTYVFDVEVDDNVKIVLDGKTLIDYNPKKADEIQSDAQEAKNYRSTSAKIKLKAGSHPIEISYEERDVNASVKLYWSTKTMKKQIVKCFTTGGLLSCQGLSAVYSCEVPNVCYTQTKDALYAIALEYTEDQLVLNIDKPAENMQVMMLGCDKVLPWKYKDGKLCIDTTPLKYSDLKSTAAWVFKMK
ncbi:MAG: alpha-L-fucosidase [Bacteroidales bacterium]|nr:alpha-L-fucosidase [Bacteroidales bacterium]